jgi:hypothetical protein
MMTARLAAGISLVRRFRLSPAILVGLSAFTAIFPLLWQRYWTYMTGNPTHIGLFDVTCRILEAAVLTAQAAGVLLMLAQLQTLLSCALPPV